MLNEQERGALRFRLGKLSDAELRQHPVRDVVALLDSLDEMDAAGEKLARVIDCGAPRSGPCALGANERCDAHTIALLLKERDERKRAAEDAHARAHEANEAWRKMLAERDEARTGAEKAEALAATKEKLLTHRDAFIANLSSVLGPCEEHGAGCMPHIEQEVKRLKDGAEARLRAVACVVFGGDLPEGDGWWWAYARGLVSGRLTPKLTDAPAIAVARALGLMMAAPSVSSPA